MNFLQQLNDSIAYLEANMDGEIEIEEAAKQTLHPSFITNDHFIW